MFRVQASHEAAIVLRNQLARYTTGRIITNRHPGSDHFHIEMDQDVARTLLSLIRTARREDTTSDDHPGPLSRARPTV